MSSHTPTQQTEMSTRRIESMNKNKAFQEDIQSDKKEMIRAMSHVSFTNQTDMFDHYDSQNSTMNDQMIADANGDIMIHNFDDDIENGNVPMDTEEGTSIRNSFLNLRTSTNKFFENEEAIDRTAFDNFTNNSIMEMMHQHNFDEEV